MVMRCPGCSKEDHLYLHKTRLMYFCFKCGLKGTEIGEVDGRRAEWRLFLSSLGEPREAPKKGQVDLGASMYPVTSGEPPKGCPVQRAVRYLQSRGLTYAQMNRYMVSVRPLEGRVWFPYWVDGEMTWAMGRAMGSQEPKTIDTTTDKPLYGLHVHRPPARSDVFLVEGVFDHFATPGSLAVCGSTVSRAQCFDLYSLEPARVFVLFDPDAEEKALSASEQVRAAGMTCYPVLWRKNEKDPAELGRVLMGSLVEGVRKDAPVRQQALYLRV